MPLAATAAEERRVQGDGDRRRANGRLDRGGVAQLLKIKSMTADHPFGIAIQQHPAHEGGGIGGLVS
jgi:hypothetical protein